MARKTYGEAKYWRLGAGAGIMVAAVTGVAHLIWPKLSETAPFVALVVLGVLVAAFLVTWLVRPK